eukprot:270827-Chlamydomonas_euryale.AAC.6
MSVSTSVSTCAKAAAASASNVSLLLAGTSSRVGLLTNPASPAESHPESLLGAPSPAALHRRCRHAVANHKKLMAERPAPTAADSCLGTDQRETKAGHAGALPDAPAAAHAFGSDPCFDPEAAFRGDTPFPATLSHALTHRPARAGVFAPDHECNEHAVPPEHTALLCGSAQHTSSAVPTRTAAPAGKVPPPPMTPASRP